MSGFIRRWWPLGLFAVVAGVLQSIVLSRYDVGGHAAEHLSSASAVFFAGFLIATLLYVTPPARQEIGVLVAGAAWLVTLLLITIGNIRVVDALIDAGLSTTPTDGLVESSDIKSAHYLADLAPLLAVVTGLALIIALYRYRHISMRVCIGACAVTIVIPPWLIPGLGVFVAVVARCIAFYREGRTAMAEA